MKNGLYTEKELLAEAERTGYTLSNEPDHLINAMNQHGMLKGDTDEKILKVLISQFSNSVIGKMDIANPPMGALFPEFNAHKTRK